MLMHLFTKMLIALRTCLTKCEILVYVPEQTSSTTKTTTTTKVTTTIPCQCKSEHVLLKIKTTFMTKILLF